MLFQSRNYYSMQGFGAGAARSRGIWLEQEPVTLARLRLHLKYLFNNSLKLYKTYPHLMSFLK